MHLPDKTKQKKTNPGPMSCFLIFYLFLNVRKEPNYKRCGLNLKESTDSENIKIPSVSMSVWNHDKEILQKTEAS